MLSFLRLAGDRPTVGPGVLACVANFSGGPHSQYRVGLPQAGRWRELVNTDAADYGGSGVGNLGAVEAVAEPWHGQPASAVLTLPPLGVLWLVPDDEPAEADLGAAASRRLAGPGGCRPGRPARRGISDRRRGRAGRPGRRRPARCRIRSSRPGRRRTSAGPIQPPMRNPAASGSTAAQSTVPNTAKATAATPFASPPMTFFTALVRASGWPAWR